MRYLLTDHAVQAAARRLRDSLAAPGLDQAVAAYFAEPAFAGMTFTTLGRNPSGDITADDLLAVSLLDITWRAPVVRILLEDHRLRFAELLAAVPDDLDLWDATDVDFKPIDALWDALIAVDGIGTASATKLLARKRPRLCPITDNVVIKAVDVPGRTWETLRYLLQDADVRAEVEALRPVGATGASLLRILDVALWICYGRSSTANSFRARTLRLPA